MICFKLKKNCSGFFYLVESYNYLGQKQFLTLNYLGMISLVAYMAKILILLYNGLFGNIIYGKNASSYNSEF